MIDGHRIIPGFLAPTLLLLAALAACSPTVSTEPRHLYEPPNRSAVNSVALDQVEGSGSVSAIAARLAAAGLTVVSSDPAAGRIRARATSSAFIDCGRFTQEFAGNRSALPANASRSILFVDGFPGGVVRRRVQTSSEFDIRVKPGAGRVEIGESHRIHIEIRTVDGSRLLQEERQVATGAAPARFSGGVDCRPSGAIAEIIAG